MPCSLGLLVVLGGGCRVIAIDMILGALAKGWAGLGSRAGPGLTGLCFIFRTSEGKLCLQLCWEQRSRQRVAAAREGLK